MSHVPGGYGSRRGTGIWWQRARFGGLLLGLTWVVLAGVALVTLHTSSTPRMGEGILAHTEDVLRQTGGLGLILVALCCWRPPSWRDLRPKMMILGVGALAFAWWGMGSLVMDEIAKPNTSSVGGPMGVAMVFFLLLILVPAGGLCCGLAVRATPPAAGDHSVARASGPSGRAGVGG